MVNTDALKQIDIRIQNNKEEWWELLVYSFWSLTWYFWNQVNTFHWEFNSTLVLLHYLLSCMRLSWIWCYFGLWFTSFKETSEKIPALYAFDFYCYFCIGSTRKYRNNIRVFGSDCMEFDCVFLVFKWSFKSSRLLDWDYCSFTSRTCEDGISILIMNLRVFYLIDILFLIPCYL